MTCTCSLLVSVSSDLYSFLIGTSTSVMWSLLVSAVRSVRQYVSMYWRSAKEKQARTRNNLRNSKCMFLLLIKYSDKNWFLCQIIFILVLQHLLPTLFFVVLQILYLWYPWWHCSLLCRRCQAGHVPQSFIDGDEWLRDVTSHHGFSRTTFLLYLTEIRICYWSREVIGKFFSWVREFHFESKKSWKSEIFSRLSSRGKMVALSDTKTGHKFMINLWLVCSFSL